MTENCKINLSYFSQRTEIIKHKKYKPKPEAAHLVRYKPKLEYEYYICDYCKQEIKIEKKWKNKTGGIIVLPATITGREPIEIAIHNKCLGLFIKELEAN